MESTTQLLYDQWQLWEITYVVGSGSWEWLVNGVGDSSLGLNPSADSTAIGAIMFFGNQNQGVDGGCS